MQTKALHLMEAQSIEIIPVGQTGSILVCTWTWKLSLLGRISFWHHGYPNGSDVPLFLDGNSPFWLCLRTFGKESEMLNIKL